jgi:hypothetical protein
METQQIYLDREREPVNNKTLLADMDRLLIEATISIFISENGLSPLSREWDRTARAWLNRSIIIMCKVIGTGVIDGSLEDELRALKGSLTARQYQKADNSEVDNLKGIIRRIQETLGKDSEERAA